MEVAELAEHRQARAAGRFDAESHDWLDALRTDGETQRAAIARLHDLLLGAARFEVRRRQGQLAFSSSADLDEIARDAAGDALVSVLAHLDDFRGLSRFRTWAYKFALLEASVKVRRRAWRSREAPTEASALEALESPALGPGEETEQRELMRAIRQGIDVALTPRQRQVLVALAINGMPIDVLAEDLATTRGALYKVLHDARQALRRHLADSGLDLGHARLSGGTRADT